MQARFGKFYGSETSSCWSISLSTNFRPQQLADIKFNLVRAIELLGDMNHQDMDVTAPPSASNFYKEIEVAQRLNIFLGQLIEEGVFDDCEPRGRFL